MVMLPFDSRRYWLVLVGHESEEWEDVTATVLHIMIMQHQFILMLLLMCDILPTVNQPSKIFQMSIVDVEVVVHLAQTTINKFKHCKQEDGECLSDIKKLYVKKAAHSTINMQIALCQDVRCMNKEICSQILESFGFQNFWIHLS